MGSIKFPHASGNSMSIAAPATNPASDLELKLPATIGTAGQALVNSSTAGVLEFSGSARRVLEQFYSPCDGSVIATSAGNLTLPTVTSVQYLTTSYADVTGSSITYTPPAGATQVIYRFTYHWARAGDDNTRAHFKFFIDSDEVTNARVSNGAGGNFGGEGQMNFEWGINIGGTANTDTGRQASWSSGKALKITSREYEGTVEQKLHKTYYWDGAASAQLSQPSIGITAIG